PHADGAVDPIGRDASAEDASSDGAVQVLVPDTTLLAGPDGSVPSGDALIMVGANVDALSFVCRLDGEPFEPCASRVALHDLALGMHAFSIAVRDASGELDPTPLELSWTVIATPRLHLDSIGVGYNHACAIDERHRLWCWGANALGQLGVGDSDERAAPARVGDGADWQAVALGRFHSCGLRAGGSLFCWGASAFGQAGTLADAVLEPSVVTAPEGTWTAVATGDWHSCAISSSGTVYCWGYNLLGRLGDGHGLGTSADPEAFVSAPVIATLARPATAIGAGAAHSCALDDHGDVWCWGGDERGQLGASASDACKLSDADAPCALTPHAIGVAASFATLSVGANHACAIDDGAALWCWGAAEYGQLGYGDALFSQDMLAIGGEWSVVACGGSHTCGIDGAGALACFGDHVNGQLGFGSESSTSPVATGSGRAWLAVRSGALGSCALDAAHDGYCWGHSAYSQSSVPALVVMP
ncbi:MAG TPA: hypothetical protein VK509_11535, partial [Polyangiales bacterium]|nr:hypothetical protein [Polyangiales bacterium]